MVQKILIVEDSTSLRKILEDVISSQGYAVALAENGKVAFDMLQKEEYPVVVTDLEMPVMDGSELIDKMQTLPEVPVIIVLTSHDDSNLIIDIMRKGVFDYLLKPVKKTDLYTSIDHALKAYELNRMQKIAEKEKVIRLEHQLEWYKFAERMGRKSTKVDQNLLFENLQRSMNQGSGLGAMFSLVEILTSTAVQKGGVYEIDGKIIDQLIENQKIVYQAMIIFSEIEKLSVNKLQLKPHTMKEIYDMLGRLVGELKSLADINSHSLLLCDEKTYFGELSLEINQDYFIRLMKELILNAMKFSEPKTQIYVFIDREGGDAVFSVINNTKSATDDGIPMEYENIVFEPFFRKVKFLEDDYKTLDYGLGLTFSEKIVQRHNGKISIYNIQDYTDISRNPMTKVNCRVVLPIAQKDKAIVAERHSEFQERAAI